MLIENVHPQADHAEIKDFLTQGGTVVHLELFRDYHIATVSMGYFLFPSLDLLLSWASVANASTCCLKVSKSITCQP